VGRTANSTKTAEDVRDPGKTASPTKFYQEGSSEKLINRKKGKSQAFKAVSRSELNLIKGNRPKYEEDFHNDFNRYRVKYKHQDAKILG